MFALLAVLRSLYLFAATVGFAGYWLLGALVLLISLRPRAQRQRFFAETLTRYLDALGATYIKLGQIMSTRPDLLPPHLTTALARLQDQVAPFAYTRVQRTFVEDFGAIPETLFSEFNAVPIAAASIAQVHKARLADGRLVAVKVRRPHLERWVRFDLGVIRLFAQLIALVPSYRLLGPIEIANEFGTAIWAQLDLAAEAANNRRFRTLFAGDPDVRFAELVPDLCSPRILTMSFIEGRKMLPHVGSAEEASRLAKAGFHALLRMIFEFGFVHADLHPGNIVVTPEGHIALIDLGLVGELDDAHRIAFTRFFALWAAGDGRAMARIMLEMAPPGATPPDPEGFQDAVHEFILPYLGRRLGEVSVGKVAIDIMQLLRKHRVRVNTTFTTCNLAIAIVEGIGRQLDPSLDLMQEALPFFMKIGLPATSPPAN